MIVLRALVVVDVALELYFSLGQLGVQLLQLIEAAHTQGRQHRSLLLLGPLVVVEVVLKFLFSHVRALQ